MASEPSVRSDRGFLAILLVFLKLGLTSFGGPVAHLGYFRDEFVIRRRWLNEGDYADLVALCQFLPGPASSQVGMALGMQRAGYTGALAAWIGFTLPSALVLILFALEIAHDQSLLSSGALHGLKVVAVPVVVQAVWGMAKSLCPDRLRISLMGMACCVVLMVPSVWGQMGVIVGGGLIGLFFQNPACIERIDTPCRVFRRRVGGVWLALFFVLLFGLPVLAQLLPEQGMRMVDVFYRGGSLVFGGGHVVLPLLQVEVVPTGWVGNDVFMAGSGAAQAVPGPLFTFAAFLGASAQGAPTGWGGGLLALGAIFTPSFLLVAGVLPFWEQVRRNRRMQAALAGVNAAVVGLLLAALYHPVWTSAIFGPMDFSLALLAFIALVFWKIPPWLVVLICAAAGWFLVKIAI